jgi:hypothetical protein
LRMCESNILSLFIETLADHMADFVSQEAEF